MKVPLISRLMSKAKIVKVKLFLALLCIPFCPAITAKDDIRSFYNAVSDVDQGKQFKGKFGRHLGFVDGNTAVFEDVQDILRNTGRVVLWDVRKKKVSKSIELSQWVDNYTLALSSDGRWLVANNSRTSSSIADVKTHRTTIIRSSTLVVQKRRNYSASEDAGSLLFLSGDTQHVVVKAVPLVMRNGTLDYGTTHLDWFNINTGKVDKSVFYRPANQLDKLVASSGEAYLLGLFYSDTFNPYGQSDYAPLQDQLERSGFVDVIDPKTGKILWHVAATKQMPVGDPLFFISPTRFISSDTLFNIATKTARHWNAITPTRKCLAAVPGHANCALFLTPSGLQLRDWQKDKLLVSWPNIKKPGRILFSPDLKMFSFKRGSLIQFWRFDPKWLR